MTKKQEVIPSMIKNQRLVQERRQQIVEGAVRLFIEKGFHKTTTREIARECGLSIGTMYEYIQSKEDVLYLVCHYIHSLLLEKLHSISSHHLTAKEMLSSSLAQYFQIMDELRPYVVLIYQETKSLPREQMKLVLAREEEITLFFEKMLVQGIEDGSFQIPVSSVRLTAHNIVVLGQMWAFRYWALRKMYTLEEYTEKQVSLLMIEILNKG
ncbi:TetR/AcrR family transcriptional regulator [Thermoactinomyces sp. DSM 45892]|uniref:TetR/AcrR family transcriptional regulator n=1 Tax=Thermoactinomyces sp. DSM 45892 TaxID=1882753 RepID=UPI000895A9AF|nr:TetR/AcrR family transcriptional regulator [Thermoactinomyces sp. DSM 45892]SDY40102.1 transcriptional regulator, TetR family [Thermoactinomyces sp. DSM 45892]